MTDAASRREFLTGKALQGQLEAAGGALADVLRSATAPSRGPMLVLRTAAMATDFDVLLNPDGPDQQLAAASDALELVHVLEQKLSSYRDDSDLMRLNRALAGGPVTVDEQLFALLYRAAEISRQTGGAFDPASGPLIQLWRDCRREARIPAAEELARALASGGVARVQFQPADLTVALMGRRELPEEGLPGGDRDPPALNPQPSTLNFFNLGAIGKGYAVDRAGELLSSRGVTSWLIHGGKSSVRCQGDHAGHDGWPIGLQNPLLPDRPVLTLLLKDAALGTSGTAVQGYRHQGRRYGHILDPRTGWPSETPHWPTRWRRHFSCSESKTLSPVAIISRMPARFCSPFPGMDGRSNRSCTAFPPNGSSGQTADVSPRPGRPRSRSTPQGQHPQRGPRQNANP
jgi:thiamine biosynthesis lipoprotein